MTYVSAPTQRAMNGRRVFAFFYKLRKADVSFSIRLAVFSAGGNAELKPIVHLPHGMKFSGADAPSAARPKYTIS